LVSTAQQFGGAAGVAVIGVIFFGLLASQATAGAVAVTGAEAVRLNFSRAAEQTIWCLAGAFLVAFLLAFLLPRKAQSHQP
jgi:cell division protein FtsW (lipid II flippase)